MELFTFTIAAGETKVFKRAGRYIEIIDATNALNIELYDASGGRSDSARNAVSGLFIEDAYSEFTVYSATAQSITLLVHEGRGGSRRQPGVVRVIDDSAQKTVDGRQGAFAPRQGPDAVAISGVGMLTGTRRFAVKRLAVSSATAGNVQLFLFQGLPLTAYTTGTGAVNKSAGMAALDCISVYFKPLAVGISTSDFAWIEAFATHIIAANVPSYYELTTPFVLPPGYGIGVNGQVVNRDVRITLDVEMLDA